MAITIQCTECQKRYSASENMAGKKVKCKHCGAIFAVPALAGADSGGDDHAALASLAEVERRLSSSDSTASGTRVPGANSPRRAVISDPALLASLEEQREAEEQEPKPNKSFDFPMADLLDQWVPYILVLLGVLWIGAEMRSADGPNEVWIPYARTAVILFIYWAVTFPVTLAGVRAAARKLRVELPRDAKWRTFATFFLPLTLSCVLWLVDNSIGWLIGGALVGVALSYGTYWLLFRLDPREAATSLLISASYFLVGLALGIVVLVGLNLAVLTILKAARMEARFDKSPFMQGFAWEITAQPPSQTASNTPANQPAVPTPAPTATARPASIASALVNEVVDTKPIGQFQQIVYPSTPSSWMAVIQTVNSTDHKITRWMIDPLVAKGDTTIQPDPDYGGRYIFSPNGDYLAYLVTWPGFGVQVWSFENNGILRDIQIQGAPKDFKLLGFLSSDRFVILETTAQDLALLIYNAKTGETLKRIDLPRNLDLPSFQRSSSNMAVSQDWRTIALAAKVGSEAQMLVIDTLTGSIRKLPIAVLDARWPVVPAGIAFSPDAKKVGVLFANGRNAIGLAWDLVSGKELYRQRFLLSSPFELSETSPAGDGLDWVGDSDIWLVLGHIIYDLGRNKQLAQLPYAGTRDQHVSGRSTIEITALAADGTKQLQLLKLDRKKLSDGSVEFTPAVPLNAAGEPKPTAPQADAVEVTADNSQAVPSEGSSEPEEEGSGDQ